MSYIYLASPYSNTNLSVQEKNYRAVRDWVANHMRLYRSPVLFSPILHCHDLAKANKLPTDAGYWEAYNITMLKGSYGMWVLKLPGWTTSRGLNGDPDKGIVGELALAKQLNKTIRFVDLPKEHTPTPTPTPTKGK